jgi:D-glycero-D-manno-heptose 1,7-bisphosphate phosphatase
MSPPRLALLDRDGTLNRKAPEGDYVTHPGELELLDGAAEAVRRLNDAAVPVAVVTNQRAIALGRLTEPVLAAIHAELGRRLAAAGARVDAFYHCPHERGTCGCRKPEPGLLEAAVRDFGVAPADAVMIGDAASDVEAGRRAGTRTVRIGPGSASAPGPDADLVAPDLRDAVELVLA